MYTALNESTAVNNLLTLVWRETKQEQGSIILMCKAFVSVVLIRFSYVPQALI
jgi:hypothetical protein